MMNLASKYIKKLSCFLANPIKSLRSSSMGRCRDHLLLGIDPFFVHLLYFIAISFLGCGVLKGLKPRTEPSPRNIDFFFTSVSAATVSSMSTVEMEVFSNAQLLVIATLMFVGGEVFTSMVWLHLKRFKYSTTIRENITNNEQVPNSSNYSDHVLLTVSDSPESNKNNSALKFLASVVLAYLLAIQVLGFSCVMIYLTLVPSANDVLKNKGIKPSTFSVFTIVSTFASCGFVPTNENMIVFKRNSGLLLILIPQILLGNTLYPPCLRFSIWVLGKTKVCESESRYLLQNNTGDVIGYWHLLPGPRSRALVGTVMGLLLIGFGLFGAMEWDSSGLNGLDPYQKVVAGVFESANARHTGLTVVDLSAVAPAVLVLFVVMMYLPPYTSFLPVKSDEGQIPPKSERLTNKKWRKSLIQDFIFSPLSYLAIFVIAICITERKSLRDDPLNFSVLNIVLEVVSAYGNVGFTTGYSCERRIRVVDPNCVNKWYGFAGKWSDGGKVILMMVMFFGRLKQFSMAGGRAWKLS